MASAAQRETIDRFATTSEHNRNRASGVPMMKLNLSTPRALAFSEAPSEPQSSFPRRRGSIPDSSGNVNRPPYKSSSLSYSKTYNTLSLTSKPEVPGMIDGFEAVDSSAGPINAPSTMWDEVDKMKSQIERIQKKGTIPASSAISRGSDERPPTATTTVTTMSTSPKRGPGNATTQPADASSTASSTHKEPHSILQTALAKSKSLLSPEVYRAIEAAASDALALAVVMGTAGQPGPISSGASSIGNGTTVTDRQLRRKADSVCRSLTELCIALTEDAPRARKSSPIVQSIEVPNLERDGLANTTAGVLLSAPPTRRPSAAEVPSVNVSPRNVSRLEERRNNLINNNSSVSSPRFLPNNTPTEANVAAGRKSSLLISRTRRAGTEEPDDGMRSSILARTRRAGTEEPDEGRKLSLYVRGRRNTTGDDDDETRFRVPSRSNTEASALRPTNRERETAAANHAASAESNLGASALPRRRLFPSTLGTPPRLATPSSTPATGRRYLDRTTTPDRETIITADRCSEERAQRQYIRPSTALGRSGSLSRRTRDSTICGPSAAGGSSGYRHC